MKQRLRMLPATAWLALTSALMVQAASSPEPIVIWPPGAPDEKGGLDEEKDLTKATDELVADKPVIRLGNVSQPTITIYRAPREKETGAAVVVCPGGGYHILAMDLEGTEVAKCCLALKKANVPAEMHLYASGGHGYGLRPSPLAVTAWPERAEQWLRGLGVLDRRN